MSRVVTRCAVLLTLAAVLPFGSAALAQAPPVRVPEAPPELPGDEVNPSPSPQGHAHDHSGHAHDGHSHDGHAHGGHSHVAPADRPPTLDSRSVAPAPVAPPYGVGPHGGQVVPVDDGRLHVELVYDRVSHAITIYLPPSMSLSAHEFDLHGPALPGGSAPSAFAPPGLHDDAYTPYPCPLGRESARASSCPLCPQEAYRQPIQHDYECEYERQNRGAASLYPADRVAPYPARGH
jgi:hypothetical protein